MKPSLFRSLIELTTDAVFIVRVLPGGKEFRMEYVNDAYLHKFNVTRESVVGKEFREMLHANIVDTIRKRFMDCVQLRSNISFEESFENGTTSLSELFPIMDTDDVIEYVVGVSKDITELKMKRDQIAASEQTLQSIINSSDNVLIYMSNDFTIRYANRRAQDHARKLFGKTFSMGEKLTDYYPEEEKERALAHALQLKQQKQTISYEHQLTYPDGEVRWFLRRYYGVFDEKSELTGIVIASINITNRKEQEIQIQKQADALREIAKIQSQEIRKP
ncbi:MAG: PAS domain-containing protein [Chitinophagaceae bacterium]|nr:PAS domain-containing protein [Chitinophagaceae bacterium]